MQVTLYLVLFGLSLYSLNALHFEKLLKGNHMKQAQLLYVLLAMALAYLCGEFMLGLVI